MKRLLCIFIILVLVLSLLALPISADEATTEASNEESADLSDEESTDSSNEESTDLSNEESTDSSDEESTDSSDEESKGFFEKAADFFSNTEEFFSFPIQIFNWNIVSIDGEGINLTLREGGFNYVSEKSSPINTAISAVYKVIYPIGFIIMLLCWAFGIAKSTISASLDIKDKNSIIHSVIGLIIGVAAMSLAPQILTTLTGISRWLCNSIFDQSVLKSILGNLKFGNTLNIQDVISKTSNTALFTIIVLLVVDLIFMINILWIALLQCLSPIFVGLMANEGTRKIGFNFIKEYFKALLVPSVTLIYFFLASTLAGVSHAGGIIVALVLAISTLGIAGKKLDKLIN